MGRFGGHETRLRQRRRRDVRARAAAGRGERGGDQGRARGGRASCAALLARPGPDPPLLVDPDLRPEGRQGPLVRTLAVVPRPTTAAGRRRGRPRRCCAPSFAAGDARAGRGRSSRWPTRSATRRAASARPPCGRSAGSRRGWKPSGCPGASTRRCTSSSARAGCPTSSGWPSCSSCGTPCASPELRTTRTLAALARRRRRRAAVIRRRGRRRPARGLAASPPGSGTRSCWCAAARRDALPAEQAELAASPRLLGYPPDGSQDLVQDWRRAARRARAVMERVFYG